MQQQRRKAHSRGQAPPPSHSFLCCLLKVSLPSLLLALRLANAATHTLLCSRSAAGTYRFGRAPYSLSLAPLSPLVFLGGNGAVRQRPMAAAEHHQGRRRWSQQPPAQHQKSIKQPRLTQCRHGSMESYTTLLPCYARQLALPSCLVAVRGPRTRPLRAAHWWPRPTSNRQMKQAMGFFLEPSLPIDSRPSRREPFHPRSRQTHSKSTQHTRVVGDWKLRRSNGRFPLLFLFSPPLMNMDETATRPAFALSQGREATVPARPGLAPRRVVTCHACPTAGGADETNDTTGPPPRRTTARPASRPS